MWPLRAHQVPDLFNTQVSACVVMMKAIGEGGHPMSALTNVVMCLVHQDTRFRKTPLPMAAPLRADVTRA